MKLVMVVLAALAAAPAAAEEAVPAAAATAGARRRGARRGARSAARARHRLLAPDEAIDATRHVLSKLGIGRVQIPDTAASCPSVEVGFLVVDQQRV